VDLAPGESLDFIFGIFVPITTPVSAGAWLGDSMSMSVFDAAGALQSWTPDRTLTITVQDDPSQPGELPEPASLALVGAGLYGLWRMRRTRAM
jgi:hypothetical protein